MKSYIPFCLLFIFQITSCTKVIELDLNNSDPQLVIEGSVSDSFVVKLTKSINFDQTNTYPTVQNSTIKITDNLGNSETLIEKSNGMYSSSQIGVVGRTYFLDVNSDSKNYTAQSTMPSKINFDNLLVEKKTSTSPRQGNTTSYQITVQYADPANQSNYYRFVEYINDIPQASIFVYDDRLTDGKNVSTNLNSTNRKLNTGDKLTIEMQCIDKSVYTYFHSFGNLGNGPQNATTPANPYTNIIGGKLGFFNAHTSQKKTVIVP